MCKGFEIGEATREHLSQICRLERSAGLGPWTPDAYGHFLSSREAIFLVATSVGRPASPIVGYCLARVVPPEAEILKLAVFRSSRRRGIGRELVQAALRRAVGEGADRCWLEVREGNRQALEFYRRLGFEISGRRPGYYRHPEEAALVLRGEAACILGRTDPG